MRLDRWEFGSDFHRIDRRGAPSASPWGAESVYTSNGRDALTLLASDVRGRWFVPTYFCHEVIASWSRAGLEVVPYADGPWDSASQPLELPLEAGDAVMTASFFGVRPPRVVTRRPDVLVVEDHTHDPWGVDAFESRADYAFGSLRKTLPVPDGGVLWSPIGRALPAPPPPTATRAAASDERWAAMELKARYLAGEPVEKGTFRALAVRGEGAIGQGEPSAISTRAREILRSFDLAGWRAARARNWRTFRAAFDDDGRVSLLDASRADAPFSIVLSCRDANLCTQLRTELIAAQVYPAVLWRLPADSPFGEHRERGERTLSLPCDARYDEADLRKVAALVTSIRARCA